MVVNATSLTRSGLRDWLWQRFSAIVLAIYVFFLVFFFLTHPHLEYLAWHHLFMLPAMKIFTLFTLFNLLVHAWVGMWTVVTDYVKPTTMRLVVYGVMLTALIGYFFWGFEILWGL